MQPILNPNQIAQVDKLTIDREPITSIKLMQRAALKCADWITARFSSKAPIVVFCGIGNNGGDGLVIAHELLNRGYNVQVYVVRFANSVSDDFQFHFKRLVEKHFAPSEIIGPKDIPDIDQDALVVDAIFGNGLNRPLEGIAKRCVEVINASKTKVVSIDMPSGLFANQKFEPKAICVNAWITLTFQLPKLSLLLPASGKFSEQFEIMDIGLDSLAINEMESKTYILDTISEYRSYFSRGKFTHKGSFGLVLVIAGRYGSMGAATLCTDACVRSGSGLVTAAIPSVGMDIMQIGVPDAMAMEAGERHIKSLPALAPYSVVVVGPGLGQNEETERALLELVGGCSIPMIIDADALNILSKHPEALNELPKGSILTPHPKEFERLFGATENDFDRIALLRDKAVHHEVTIVLKGAHTAIATSEGNLYFNSTGNSGLATGGSGDVLSGIIAGFMAQSTDPAVSAICGVYLHGLAADIAVETKSPQSLAASDIMSTFGRAMKLALHL
ncbi:MAG: bifunctional ADP-dependent NAD(P)H-hydrate dehydratase/NAD(P)H-hydrate epimerase [Salibacteraceae bacterium]